MRFIMNVHVKSLQSCLTPWNPMDCSFPGSSVHGILQARIWEGLPFPFPGDLPDPGIEPMSLMSPALAGRFFTTSTTWEAQFSFYRWANWSPERPQQTIVVSFRLLPAGCLSLPSLALEEFLDKEGEAWLWHCPGLPHTQKSVGSQCGLVGLSPDS